MPMYEYQCEQCGPFDQMNLMSSASEPAHCPSCGHSSRRNIAAPYLASSSQGAIKVARMNERAQHEPRHSSELKHKHSGGCCGSHSSRISNKTMSNAAGDKMFPSMRPWMISH